MIVLRQIAPHPITLQALLAVLVISNSASAQTGTAAMRLAIDSLSAGLVRTDTSAAFTYERFGIELLRAAVRRGPPDSSRVLSPLSAGQALAVALGAAKDSTAIVIGRALQLGQLSPDSLASRSARFNAAVRARTDLTLRVANALWVDTSATLQPTFERWARTLYGASVRAVPLTKSEIVGVINRWADSVTNGLIRTVRNTAFKDGTKVALANAVYFKGDWMFPFDSLKTESRPFTIASGERITVPAMEHTDGFAFRAGNGYRALRLPYAAGLSAMYIILPDSGVSARALLDTLATSHWPIPRDQAVVHLVLPRMRLAQATDLRDPFTDLGMGMLFDGTRADFSGLVAPRPGQPPQCLPLSSGVRSHDCTRVIVGEAAQHTFIEVNERGTEAAAISLLSMPIPVSGAPPPPLEFVVDRPFLFALRDEQTGTFLFMAYIVDPRK